MSESSDEQQIEELIRFVDDSFGGFTVIDIFSSNVYLAVIVGWVIAVGIVSALSLAYMTILQWIPILVSISAMLIAYIALIMASRKYANRRLAYRVAKRMETNLPSKNLKAKCLLPPLVALKMGIQPVKLQDLYEVDAGLFDVSRLIESYYPD